jgi:nitrite reductase/ring-hydroxylating ferredoxin subunit
LELDDSRARRPEVSLAIDGVPHRGAAIAEVARRLLHWSGVRGPTLKGVMYMAAETVTGTKASDIPRGALALIEINGTRITVANVDGTYYAFDDACTHEQCSLSDGDLEGTKVVCMCHGAEFDVTTGQVLAPPAQRPLKVYPVHVAGDVLRIEV